MPSAARLLAFALLAVACNSSGVPSPNVGHQPDAGGRDPSPQPDGRPADTAPVAGGGPWAWRVEWFFPSATLAAGCAAAGTGAQVEVLVGIAGKTAERHTLPCEAGRLQVMLDTEYTGTALARLVRGGRLLYESTWRYGDVHDSRQIPIALWYPPSPPSPGQMVQAAIPLCSAVPRVGTDPLELQSIALEGRTLFLGVRDVGGGCRAHTLGLCRDDFWRASDPPQMWLYLGHRTLGDGCDSDFAYQVPFDLTGLIEEHRREAAGTGPRFTLQVIAAPSLTIDVSY
jgi:hypothetical protein